MASGPKRKTKGGAMFRSLVVPGFGQFYSGKTLSAAGFLLAEAGLIGMVVKSSGDYTSYQDEYNTQLNNYTNATVPEDIADFKALVQEARANMNDANSQVGLFTSLAAGVWVLNTVHALLTGPSFASNEKISPPVRLAYDPKLNQTKLEWRVSLW